MNRQVPRSMSSPQIRESLGSESEADKKRNKLGYQRISIACAHCRRRKIRCLIAEGDPQQRCQNCIRLKKECVFYPVDQQTAMEHGPPGSANSGVPSGPSSIVSASSPTGNPERSYDQVQEPQDYSVAPIPPTAPFQHPAYEHGGALHGQGGYTSSEQGFHQRDGPRMPWAPPGSFPPEQYPVMSNAPIAPSPQHMWHYNPAGVPNEAPYQSEGYSGHYSQAHPSQQWSQSQHPVRSMSYPDIQTNESYLGHQEYHEGFRSPHVPLHTQHPGALSMSPAGLAPGHHHSSPVTAQPVQAFVPSSPYAFQRDQNGGGHATLPSQQTPFAGHWYPPHQGYGALEEEHESTDYGSGANNSGHD